MVFLDDDFPPGTKTKSPPRPPHVVLWPRIPLESTRLDSHGQRSLTAGAAVALWAHLCVARRIRLHNDSFFEQNVAQRDRPGALWSAVIFLGFVVGRRGGRCRRLCGRWYRRSTARATVHDGLPLLPINSVFNSLIIIVDIVLLLLLLLQRWRRRLSRRRIVVVLVVVVISIHVELPKLLLIPRRRRTRRSRRRPRRGWSSRRRVRRSVRGSLRGVPTKVLHVRWLIGYPVRALVVPFVVSSRRSVLRIVPRRIRRVVVLVGLLVRSSMISIIIDSSSDHFRHVVVLLKLNSFLFFSPTR